MQNVCVINNLPISVVTVFSVKQDVFVSKDHKSLAYMEAILHDYGEVFFYVSISTLLIQYNFQTLGFLAPALQLSY